MLSFRKNQSRKEIARVAGGIKRSPAEIACMGDSSHLQKSPDLIRVG